MLNVGALREGYVLDHIKAGKAMTIYHDLKLDKLDCTVAIIKNARSNKMGKKDIIKVECPEKFIQTCDFTHLLDDYHRILANLNQPVRVIDGDRSFEGICRGIDEKGELLVERQNKEVVKVSAGEVSVRGLYSYV